MRIKVLAMSSLLLLAATGALAGGPMAQTDQAVTNQAPGFNDTTTGPTNPRAPVQSPGWV